MAVVHRRKEEYKAEVGRQKSESSFNCKRPSDLLFQTSDSTYSCFERIKAIHFKKGARFIFYDFLPIVAPLQKKSK